MSSRPKRLKVCDESVVREFLDDIDDDFSSFSEFDDSDEDEHNVPSNESNNIQSDSGKKNPGFKVEIPNNATALQYFKLFISDEIIDLIVLETNRNADQILSKFRLTKSSRFSKLTPTDATEIKQFLGLLMWMELVQMPSLKDYWTPENDRIFKVRNLIHKIVNNFQNAMEPEEMMAVDETMVPFCVYASKGQDDGRGLGCSVVMNLTSLYLNAGRIIITNNFYTSLNLANALLENETHLVGTLRCNRVKLSEVTKSKLKPGQIIGKENLKGVVVAKWRDKRDVTMLSTRHNITMAGIDLSDQLSSYSSPVRKSIRWYHKVATEILLGTAVFREALINEILGLNQPLLHQDDSVPTSTSSTSRQTSSKHILDETSEKCTKNGKIRKRCAHCYKDKAAMLDQFRPAKKLKGLQLCVRNVMCILVWIVF
ncbi:hypothetical protein AGLY_016238 [Aphis glycines]|uniref:PiggyBac transposable element-derived protein domain-containing protein n=1 Tax=Aphis glycines TaxID=307491 RepID=A0A6G0SY13_APHGL|nr:hypothetical protein AGLY_016238 [Aphis glycines]